MQDVPNSATAAAPAPQPPVAFPSLNWFGRLAALMNEQRALHEKLGYVDCKARFIITDGGPGDTSWGVQIHFEEFTALSVVEVDANSETDIDRPDFSLAASFDTWRNMIESIAIGGGRPALQQTLNDLNMRSNKLTIEADDSLNLNMFFRYNQSLQAFVNASGSFPTVFQGAK